MTGLTHGIPARDTRSLLVLRIRTVLPRNGVGRFERPGRVVLNCRGAGGWEIRSAFKSREREMMVAGRAGGPCCQRIRCGYARPS